MATGLEGSLRRSWRRSARGRSDAVAPFIAGLVLACIVLLPATTQATSIVAGYGRTCAIDASGTPRCWGDDSSGALGDGASILSRIPLTVNGLGEGMRAVVTGPTAYHTCALSTSGAAYCWGNGASGQLGAGSYASSTVPVAVNGMSSGVVALALGNLHTCALTTAGAVYCWGSNQSAELGIGVTGGNLVQPGSSVVGLDSGVRAIAAGTSHTCALMTQGSVQCWGANARGQLGNGTHTDSNVPVPVAGLDSGAIAIAAGFDHTCALTAQGTVLCWGRNDHGQLGNGTTDDSALPVAVNGLSGVAAIATGDYHTCAVTIAGAALCWGDNANGQLGNGSYADSSTPSAVNGLASGVVSITAGYTHTCAMTASASSMCWGSNTFGQFADGTKTSSPTPVASAALTVPIASIVAGVYHTCALTTTGSVLCWGANTNFQLGSDQPLGRSSPSVPVGLATGFKAIATGFAHTCALNASGGVVCWGSNLEGQIGNGGFTSLPAARGPASGVTAITAGSDHTCALTDAGSALCWGYNNVGQLGDGTTVDRYDPVMVSGLGSGVAAISAGHRHTCALDLNGRALCWGYNHYSQLGNGTTTDSSVPVMVSQISGAKALSAGGWHNCVITAGGGAACWGGNWAGQLGNGANDDSSMPVTVTGLPSALASISAGDDFTCAATVAGAAYCWGANGFGQLGDGTTNDSAVPRPVFGLSSGVVAVAAGHDHACALLQQAIIQCWGYNGTGGLGDATFADRINSVVTVHENAAGSLATGDWFFDLDPSVPKAIPPDKIPSYLVDTSGNATTAVVSVQASVQFRPEDTGKPIYVYAYVPSRLVKRDGSKDGGCVLSQLDASGLPQAASASGLQTYTSNVLGAQRQSLQVLTNVLAANVAGSTFCVGTGSTGGQSIDPSNSRCLATVPTLNSGDPLCLPPGAVANVPGPLSGLWFKADEPGWGIDFTQRRNIVFAAWYTYDGAGAPQWYVASDCAMPAGTTGSNGTCSGDLYAVTGPALTSPAFDPSAVSSKSVGSVQVSFADSSHASMTYTVAGVSRTVPITRQIFRSGTTPPPIDYTDLWWDPAESGWGIAITHQYDTMFLAWFVYGAAGQPVWYVASSCAVTGNGCSGALYRTTGPAFGPTFDPAQVHLFAAGTVSVTFSDANDGTLSYSIDGTTASKPITRQLF